MEGKKLSELAEEAAGPLEKYICESERKKFIEGYITGALAHMHKIAVRSNPDSILLLGRLLSKSKNQ